MTATIPRKVIAAQRARRTDLHPSLSVLRAVPSMPGAGAEYGVGKDGSVYMMQPGEILTRLDPATGAVMNTYPTALGYSTTRFAIDADGRVFVSNGGFGTGRLFSFDPDLTLRWSVPVTNINIGGPVLGVDGTLVVAGIGTFLRAFRSPSPWTQLGGGIAGTNGLPGLSGRGTLTPGHDVTLALQNGRPGAFGVLVVGFAAGNVPLFGGTLVPTADGTVSALLDVQGAWSLTTNWLPGWPSGASVYWQFGVIDPAAPFGVAASHALRSVTP